MTFRILCATFFLGVGCAATGPGGSTTAANVGWCTIAEPAFAHAPRDFDRAATLEVIAGLRAAADADRVRLRTGAKNEVGSELDEFFRNHRSQAFISHGTGELGTRLRQLDCAVRAGRITTEKSEELYGQILAELASEQAVLDPGGGTTRRPSAP